MTDTELAPPARARNRNPVRRLACDFCGADIADVRLLFRGDRGGDPPAICAKCVSGFHVIVLLHLADPVSADEAVAAHNARVAKS